MRKVRIVAGIEVRPEELAGLQPVFKALVEGSRAEAKNRGQSVLLERFAVENGNRSGGRGSGRPRRMSVQTALWTRNDGSEVIENEYFQSKNALGFALLRTRATLAGPPLLLLFMPIYA